MSPSPFIHKEGRKREGKKVGRKEMRKEKDGKHGNESQEKLKLRWHEIQMTLSYFLKELIKLLKMLFPFWDIWDDYKQKLEGES